MLMPSITCLATACHINVTVKHIKVLTDISAKNSNGDENFVKKKEILQFQLKTAQKQYDRGKIFKKYTSKMN